MINDYLYKLFKFEKFDSINNSFSYDHVSSWKTKHHYYFLEGKLDLIDSPGEWFFDNKNDTLYFMPPEGVNPSVENIRAKTEAYGFSFYDSDRITLENIDFFATTFRFDNCDNCTEKKLTDYTEKIWDILYNNKKIKDTFNDKEIELLKINKLIRGDKFFTYHPNLDRVWKRLVEHKKYNLENIPDKLRIRM